MPRPFRYREHLEPSHQIMTLAQQPPRLIMIQGTVCHLNGRHLVRSSWTTRRWRACRPASGGRVSRARSRIFSASNSARGTRSVWATFPDWTVLAALDRRPHHDPRLPPFLDGPYSRSHRRARWGPSRGGGTHDELMRLLEEVRMHLAYRWFTTTPPFRRIGTDAFGRQACFAKCSRRVRPCLDAGLVVGQNLAVDGTMVVANASRQSRMPREQLKERRSSRRRCEST
jgi:hypothetical protein